MANTTQSAHPWRATIRTVLAVVVALAAGAPLIYTAIMQADPVTATGAAGVALAVAGAITRVMALPFVETFLRRFVPWLAAGHQADDDDPSTAEPIEFLTSDPAKRGQPGAIWVGDE